LRRPPRANSKPTPRAGPKLRYPQSTLIDQRSPPGRQTEELAATAARSIASIERAASDRYPPAANPSHPAGAMASTAVATGAQVEARHSLRRLPERPLAPSRRQLQATATSHPRDSPDPAPAPPPAPAVDNSSRPHGAASTAQAKALRADPGRAIATPPLKSGHPRSAPNLRSRPGAAGCSCSAGRGA